MKKLYILAFLAASFNVSAANGDSKTVTTELGSQETLLQENYEKFTDLKVKMDNLDSTLTAFETCKAKNKVFLGVNASGSDSDSCVDIKQINFPRKSIKPEWAGYTDSKYYGNMSTSTSAVNTSSTSEPYGRYRADFLCRNKYGVNARALTLSDLKYVYKDIKKNNRYFDTPTSSQNTIWLFDAIESFDAVYGRAVYALNNMAQANTGTCLAYTTGANPSGISGAPVLMVRGATPYEIIINSAPCSISRHIACVTE
jgi:hypothetical protein